MSIPKEPEQVMKLRGGSVLGKKTILRGDHFPGCQNKRLSPHIDGAPNYRQADSQHVHGVAIPTIGGIQNVLNHIGAQQIDGKRAQVLWINLCEEPEELRAPLESQHGDAVMEAIVKASSGSVLGKGSILQMYFFPGQRTSSHIQIHGAPHVFKVEHMEARLKEDIVSEVRQSGGRMLLHREEYSPALNQSSVIGYLESIFADDVKSPAEVYAALKDEGYNFAYRRIPLTREGEALSSDVDAIQYCIDDSAGCYLFVSHTGFGGVAYAMAIICIRTCAETNSLPKGPEPLVRMNLLCTPKVDLPSQASDEEALGMGDYRDILSLTRVLVYGPKSKADVDIVIERCAGAVHLRGDILD